MPRSSVNTAIFQSTRSNRESSRFKHARTKELVIKHAW
jgi:hypothetical protein